MLSPPKINFISGRPGVPSRLVLVNDAFFSKFGHFNYADSANCVDNEVQYQNMNRMKLVGLLYTADFHKCKLALSVRGQCVDRDNIQLVGELSI